MSGAATTAYTTPAYAVKSRDAKFEKWSCPRRAPTADDVRIQIEFFSVAYPMADPLETEHPSPPADVPPPRLRVSYSDVHRLVARCAGPIRTDFSPDTIVSIGTGGWVPAKALRAFFPTLPLLTLTLQLYDTTDTMAKVPQVLQGIDADTAARCITGRRVLVVDDVDDSRTTLAFALQYLRALHPIDVAVFVVHSKTRIKVEVPEVRQWFVGQQVDNVWIDYPWNQLDIDEHHARCQL